MNKIMQCQLCQRECALTFHHLIPRKMHRRTYFKKHFDKASLEQGIMLCRLCHKGLHTLYDEMTLAKQLNTLALLKADDRISQHVDWVRKQRIAKPFKWQYTIAHNVYYVK